MDTSHRHNVEQNNLLDKNYTGYFIYINVLKIRKTDYIRIELFREGEKIAQRDHPRVIWVFAIIYFLIWLVVQILS